MKIPFSGQRSALIFALFLMAAFAHADPENFIVGGFTFVRPPEWKWVSEDRLANVGLLLRVPGPNTNETAAVYFRKFKGEEGGVANRTKVWNVYFKEPLDKLKIRSETNSVAGFQIVYLEMEGTSTLEWPADFGLFAAIIKIKDGHFVVRMSRSKKVVNDSKIIFREMVERALKEKESD